MSRASILSEGAVVHIVCDRLPASVGTGAAAILRTSGSRLRPGEVVEVELTELRSPASWDDLFLELARVRVENGWPLDDAVALLTPVANDRNFFSASSPEYRDFFVHMGDWEWFTSAPLHAIAAYEVLLNLLLMGAREAGAGDPLDFAHREPRGCLSDFCLLKTEVAFKLRTGDICEECIDRLESSGAHPELIAQAVGILDACRRHALSVARYRRDDKTFEAWPFPVAVTRHKAGQATTQDQRVRLLLNHFDSLVRYCAIASDLLGSPPEGTLPDNPSLGWWVDRLGDSPEPCAREAARLAQEGQLVHLRNERAHGYEPAHPAERARGLEALQAALPRIETALEPVLGRALVLPRSVELVGGGLCVRGARLQGSNPLFGSFEERLPTTDGAAIGMRGSGEVGVVDDDWRRFRSLDPWIVERECPECRQPRILIIDGRSGQRWRYIDPIVGHRVTP